MCVCVKHLLDLAFMREMIRDGTLFAFVLFIYGRWREKITYRFDGWTQYGFQIFSTWFLFNNEIISSRCIEELVNKWCYSKQVLNP
jgi:hypothetical protein